MNLSVTIITYNESKNIEKCLRSVKAITDDVVIIDSFSTDDTSAIAKQLGANVFNYSFNGYGESKNLANEKAKNDWILSIDADEVLDEKLVNSILNLKDKLNNNTVYEFSRLNNYCGKWIRFGAWRSDNKIRIFNKTAVKWNLAEVHESLIIPENFVVQKLQGKLLHYSYASVANHLNKIEKYSTLGAEEAFKKGKHASFIKINFSPVFRFIRDYILMLGFLDGKYGFVIASLTAKEVYLKYVKLKKLRAR
jgi:(heptosyl)LPS beta-1,4-glucosyltransferase